MIRPSSGTARVLGFNKIKMETPPTCAYLMIGSKCSGKCLFCAQSSLSKDGDFLSRITWKPQDDGEVYRAIDACHKKGEMKRVCFQVVRGDSSLSDTVSAVKSLKKYCDIPVCVSINGIGRDELALIFNAGADKVAISFDVATPELYNKVKGESWDKLWNFYIDASREYPGRIVVHVIAGLGENEEEMVNALLNFYKQRTNVSLFAFTPLSGTPFAGRPAPMLSSYRRIQIAHYIIRNNINKKLFPDDIIEFIENRIFFSDKFRDFLLKNIPGDAFQTFGCDDCNRPNYNEKPGQIPYNYPRALDENERTEAILKALDNTP